MSAGSVAGSPFSYGSVMWNATTVLVDTGTGMCSGKEIMS